MDFNHDEILVAVLLLMLLSAFLSGKYLSRSERLTLQALVALLSLGMG